MPPEILRNAPDGCDDPSDPRYNEAESATLRDPRTALLTRLVIQARCQERRIVVADAAPAKRLRPETPFPVRGRRLEAVSGKGPLGDVVTPLGFGLFAAVVGLVFLLRNAKLALRVQGFLEEPLELKQALERTDDATLAKLRTLVGLLLRSTWALGWRLAVVGFCLWLTKFASPRIGPTAKVLAVAIVLYLVVKQGLEAASAVMDPWADTCPRGRRCACWRSQTGDHACFLPANNQENAGLE